MTYSRRTSEKTFTTSIPGTQPSVRVNSKKNTKVVKQGKYFDPVDDMYITSIEREVRDLLLKENHLDHTGEKDIINISAKVLAENNESLSGSNLSM